jgi:hypothetical protein
MDWSNDLVKKIDDEGEVVASQLATLNPSDSLPSVKVHAERKLLALTPKAIDTLDDGMNATTTKDRIAAATKVLELSPATRVQTFFGSEQSVPVEALRSIFESMAKMFKAVQPLPAKEELHEAPDQSVRTDRRPRPALARRTAFRPDPAIHVDGLPSKEVLPEPSTKAARRPKQHQAKHRKGALK